jgi:DeoR/GlpR family transcriptional regulator of sugar metabolism
VKKNYKKLFPILTMLFYVCGMTSARRRAVAALVAQSGEETLSGLAARFAVSEMTIRRDLESLERDGFIHRVKGGAISLVGRFHEPPMLERATAAVGAKRAIGIAAAGLVSDGETVILDVGTTSLECARALHGSLRLTVVTPSVLVAQELAKAPSIRTLVTGGVLRPGEMSLIGPRTEDSFSDLNCDTVFLGVGGMDIDRGLSEYNLDDARVKKAALRAAKRCVVLADKSKLGRVTFSTIAPLSAVDVLVTDAEPNDPVVSHLRDSETQIVHVHPEPLEAS